MENKRYLKFLKYKDGRFNPHSKSMDDPSEEIKVPKGWGYIKAGWYSLKEMEKEDLLIKDSVESRDRILKEEEIKLMPHFTMLLDSSGNIFKTADQVEDEFRLNNEIIDLEGIEHFKIPAKTELEYRFEDNFTIELKDLKIDQDKEKLKEKFSKEVFDELKLIVGTRNSDSAIFFYLAAIKLKANPDNFLGKKALTSEGGMVALEIMDTPEKVGAYADAVLARYDLYMEKNWQKRVELIESTLAL